MRKLLIAAFILSTLMATHAIAGDFETYFKDQTLRVDYMHTGDAASDLITLDQLYVQGAWAGSTTNLIDMLNQGRYMAKVFDLATNRLIFSKGFDSYFGEYRTSTPALEGQKRAYHESVLMPMPKGKVQFTLESRDKNYIFHRIYDTVIDPTATGVNREGLRGDTEVIPFIQSGDPHQKVDLLILAEGYTSAERPKFVSDAQRLLDAMFKHEPYTTRRNLFNVSGAFKASAESGCDEPSHGSYKRTTLGASFDSLGTYRYLLVEDNRTMRDVAAHAPYDALIILVNTKRYGGGGIYNLYSTSTADNQYSNYTFLHEFGHCFAGLADEYYTSTTSYNDFYPKGIEPIDPNVTALLDPSHVKWATTPGIEIPTPWEKADFDKMDADYQKIRGELYEKISKLKREGKSAEAVDLEAQSEKLAAEQSKKVDDYLTASKYAGTVGAFEGAGYSANGLYRPMVDCIMFTKGVKPFCKVCEAAIIRVIESYTK